jgi:hypothetical protein
LLIGLPGDESEGLAAAMLLCGAGNPARHSCLQRALVKYYVRQDTPLGDIEHLLRPFDKTGFPEPAKLATYRRHTLAFA